MGKSTQFTCPNCDSVLVAFAKATASSPALIDDGRAFVTLEHTAPGFNAPAASQTRIIENKTFWASDGVNSAVMGLFVGLATLLICWWYEWPLGWAFVAIPVVGLGMYVLRLLILAPGKPPPLPPFPAKQAETKPIQLELLSEDKKHWILDELSPGLTLDDLLTITSAIVESEYQWTREITTDAGLSQPKHRKLQDDLLRLKFLEPLPNNANGYLLTRWGRHLFDQLQALPHSP